MKKQVMFKLDGQRVNKKPLFESGFKADLSAFGFSCFCQPTGVRIIFKVNEFTLKVVQKYPFFLSYKKIEKMYSRNMRL